MIRRPASRLGVNPVELQTCQIKSIDKNVDRTDRIVLVNPVLQTFGEQRDLPSILAFNEALHLIPRKSHKES